MALLTWKDESSVHIGVIDLQHKKLVELLNQIHDAAQAGRGKDVLERILEDLVTYTKVHFSTEEDFFTKHSYPRSVQHKAEHDALTKKVLKYQEEYNSGRSALTIEVMKFLKDWLTNHILAVDKQYTPFLNAKGVR